MRNTSRTMLVLAGLLLSDMAQACEWDYDTLKMERSRFPSTLELITGKFLRHSKEFYEWRIQDRLTKLKDDPKNLAYHDDLAVAYDKIGQQQKAIETILAKDRLKPGLYETEANLGTFYLHAGQLEKGLTHLGRAIRINPDAHFGREKYQMYLAEYVMTRRRGGPLQLPLANVKVPIKENGKEELASMSFHRFWETKDKPGKDMQAPHAAAIKGVLGMMKFGSHDSPVLLEALGSLLSLNHGGYPEWDGKRLAARAYLKASYEVKNEPARSAYRAMAKSALILQTRHPLTMEQLTLEELEQDFKRELDDGKQWYADLRQKELTWIKEGKNPEQEFDKLYDEEPEVTNTETVWSRFNPKYTDPYLLLLCIVVAILLAGVFAWVLVRRKRRARIAPADNPEIKMWWQESK